MSAPLVVADRSAAGPGQAATFVAAGWSEREGLDLPVEPWDLSDRRWLCTASVVDEAGVEAAVLAAARGAGLLVGCPDPALRARLVADLRRVGPVDLLDLGPDPLEVLDDDQRAVLLAVAAGASIAEAAEVLHLSARTAERRLASARKRLGVRTTAEAVALAGPS